MTAGDRGGRDAPRPAGPGAPDGTGLPAHGDTGGGEAAARRDAGPLRALVAASAVVVALSLAAGLQPGRHWLTELLVVAAICQGALAGAAWPRFWRGGAREEIFGAGGRYAGFLAAVAFSAAEAHAVGASLGPEDAPGPAVAILLVPPLVVAAVALRSAVRHRADVPVGRAPSAPDPGGPGAPPGDPTPAAGVGDEARSAGREGPAGGESEATKRGEET